jgi:large subunit ribosomal protein L25
MADIELQAEIRTVTGKRVRRLRQQGLVPANIYGRGVESVPVQLDVRALRDVLIHAGSTTVVDLHVVSNDGAGDGKAHPVLIERVSRHPTSGTVLHVDLRQVDLNRPVRAAVPIVLVGEAPAVDQGGVLVHSLDTIEVEALPRALPHAIEVDVTHLAQVDEQVAVGDLRLPAGVTVDTDPETIVVRVVASRLEQEVAAEEEATAAALAEAAEPAEAAEAPEAREGPEPAASAEGGESQTSDRE